MNTKASKQKASKKIKDTTIDMPEGGVGSIEDKKLRMKKMKNRKSRNKGRGA